MPELYSYLGFSKHPFSRFSAEDEAEYIKDIFIQPRFYDSLKTDITDGVSCFIVGDRGSGKSAILFSLQEDLVKNKSFPIYIDNYTDIPIMQNAKEILFRITEYLITYFSIYLIANKKALKQLSKEQKKVLSTLIMGFSRKITREEINNSVQTISGSRNWNFIKRFFNSIANKPINAILSGVISISSDFFARSLGLPEPDTKQFYKEYIGPLKEETLDSYEVLQLGSLSKDDTIKILLSARDIVTTCGFSSVSILLDKTDEYNLLEGKSGNISTFLKDLCTDTTILQSRNISFVFSTWSHVKPSLANLGVRFDKFKSINIGWNNVDIKKILEKRINYFSKGKITVEKLFKNSSPNHIIELSQGSPRTLIVYCSNIYDHESEADSVSNFFSQDSIEKGLHDATKNFDYISFYASVDFAQKVKSQINRILKLGKINFTINDMAASLKKSPASISNYTREMRDFNIIRLLDETKDGAQLYEVIDKRLCYLIDKKIEELSN